MQKYCGFMIRWAPISVDSIVQSIHGQNFHLLINDFSPKIQTILKTVIL